LTGGDDHANRDATAWIRFEDWDGDGQPSATIEVCTSLSLRSREGFFV